MDLQRESMALLAFQGVGEKLAAGWRQVSSPPMNTRSMVLSTLNLVLGWDSLEEQAGVDSLKGNL